MVPENKGPLVSVLVITYNSSKYILDTLESIRMQSYDCLELIISDDASTDNTELLCQQWISKNKEFFENIKYISVENNTGVSGNLNRAFNACTGEWVKIIAGDDILLRDCIKDNLEYIYLNEDLNIQILFSKFYKLYFKNGEWHQKAMLKDPQTYILFSSCLSNNEQLKLFSREQHYRIITIFMSHKAIKSVNGFDERFPLYEDIPLMYKFLLNGFKLFLLPAYTVSYRVHGDSISLKKTDKIISKWHYQNLIPATLLYKIPMLTRVEAIMVKCKIQIDKYLYESPLNERKFLNVIIYRGLIFPFQLLYFLCKNKIIKDIVKNKQLKNIYFKDQFSHD
ncbi:glycosyltransferase family 2 protein [Flavilitoribacter nigricans]|uniref:Glycosyltransferase 2-like domain-containing protein n=1 Tax=Flavilitoribacter nigricans (strain ATCC 23147 / DSM 23189 / NBRC 102662 / NCIMB 1420 / SS-2) TaxID=1122177 RepID=A0A2D0MZ47_FLAN2|nr:glycosyltransferase [Flavilitoribacter nigricans]PHN01497.1 hypothetical protein CRP01_36970 [Flavilitoribacter nigricans DSM 23189 = NBRC 102662]